MIYLDLRPAHRLWPCLDVPEAPTDQAKRLCATPWATTGLRGGGTKDQPAGQPLPAPTQEWTVQTFGAGISATGDPVPGRPGTGSPVAVHFEKVCTVHSWVGAGRGWPAG